MLFAYQINVKLNAVTNEIIGTDEITYTNNSPDKLSFVWLNLEQNLFKIDSRGNAVVPLNGSRNGAQGQIFDGGYKINSPWQLFACEKLITREEIEEAILKLKK